VWRVAPAGRTGQRQMKPPSGQRLTTENCSDVERLPDELALSVAIGVPPRRTVYGSRGARPFVETVRPRTRVGQIDTKGAPSMAHLRTCRPAFARFALAGTDAGGWRRLAATVSDRNRRCRRTDRSR
jgi:hypothetical protein